MRSTTTALAAGLLGLALYHPAQSAETDCMDTASSQTSLNGCAHRKYTEADARLNDQYKTLTSQLSDNPKAKQLLIEAQRRWIDFRDAECRFNASAAEGGTAQPMVNWLCLADVTDQRSAELDYYLSCSEGDLSCPTWASRSD